MKKIAGLLLLLSMIANSAHALSEPPLRVAVSHFLPPFVMQGANNEMGGFDIALMNHICKAINRKCVYKPMSVAQIVTSIATKKSDVGLGALTITLERYKLVSFSLPYMLSESRFLGTKQLNSQPFELKLLKNKKIGVGTGSLFGNELKLMQNINPTIVTFNDSNAMVAALNEGSIDLALVDNSTAIYWQNHSSDALHALGKPLVFGLGLGIAINHDDAVLAQAINAAIVQYQKTPEFKQLYAMYFGQF